MVVLTSDSEFSCETAEVLAHLFEVQPCVLGRMQASYFLLLLVELLDGYGNDRLDDVHPNNGERLRFAVDTQEFS